MSRFPTRHAAVFRTKEGTPYLKEPGVVTLSRPEFSNDGLPEFLAGFGHELEFGQYVDDPTELEDALELIKTAGQTCYASFGPKRTYNEDAQKYVDNIVSSGHGSVLEHASISLLVYGISRSVSHELVRHRPGMAYSQLSQRFVSGKVLRFVERVEFAAVKSLHKRFEERIDSAAAEYDEVADELLSLQKGGMKLLSAEQRTDARKRVQQVAREVLPNETETIIVVTGNIRAWRHLTEMRTSEHADTAIRRLFDKIYECLLEVSPELFGDYTAKELDDGTVEYNTQHRKV